MFNFIKRTLKNLFTSTPAKILKGAALVATCLVALGGLFQAAAFAVSGFRSFSKSFTS